MSLGRRWMPIAVVAAAAICAAAVSHAAILALTAHGLIRGPYLSYAHGQMATAWLLAVAAGALGVLVLIGDATARADRTGADWLEEAARGLALYSVPRTITIIFVTQLATLIAVESFEQLSQFGRPLGLAAALGAPAPLALALHGAIAIAFGGFVAALMRAIVAARRLLAGARSDLEQRLHPARQSRFSIVFRTFDCDALIVAAPPLARRLASRPPPVSVAA